MTRPTNTIKVYLEIGEKRAFAGALDWPGWCRSGRDEESALQTLLDYGARYARILQPARLGFQAPTDVSALAVVERLEGNQTTDFGAPDAAPSSDARPVDAAELERLQALLKTCWKAFDAAVKAAEGKELRKGPRGGGRELDRIVEHVRGSEASYLGSLGWKLQSDQGAPEKELDRTRRAVLDGLAASAHGEIPALGPRGGARWSPRYFVRRAAWHILDHAWEIEDRAL